MNSDIDPKLAHLSDDEIQALVYQYCDTDKPVSEIVSEFGLDVRPGKVASILPPIHTTEECPYCADIFLQQKIQSRTGYSRNHPYCPSCGHGKRQPCRCSNCKQQAEWLRAHEQEAKRKAVQNVAGYYGDTPSPEDLDCTTALYLISVIKHSLSDNYYSVEPFQKSPTPLAPEGEFTRDMAMTLYRQGLISIDAQSPENAFDFSADLDCVTGFYPATAHWRFLAGLEFDERRAYVANIEFRTKLDNWPDDWFEKIDELWLSVATKECVEYFKLMMNKRDFECRQVDQRMIDVIVRGLESFSPAQMHNLIWQSARDTVDFMATRGIPYSRSQSVCRGILDRKIDRHIAEDWTPRESRRDFSCPRSVISFALFDHFLGIGESYFTQVPPKRAV